MLHLEEKFFFKSYRFFLIFINAAFHKGYYPLRALVTLVSRGVEQMSSTWTPGSQGPKLGNRTEFKTVLMINEMIRMTSSSIIQFPNWGKFRMHVYRIEVLVYKVSFSIGSKDKFI